MLHVSCIAHCYRSHHKAPKYAGDWFESDSHLPEEGVHQAITDGDEQDDSQRVDVLHDVVLPDSALISGTEHHLLLTGRPCSSIVPA